MRLSGTAILPLWSDAMVLSIGSASPRFDSGACFAALLGTEEHGRWLLRPASDPRESSRRYLDDTLVLETQYRTDEGEARVLDFMPPRGVAPDVVRIVEGIRGR